MQLPPSAAPLRAIGVEDLPPELVEAVVPADGTPVESGFFYSAEVAAARVRALRAALPTWADLCYAVKANAFEPLLDALVDAGLDGFEVASTSEVALARAASAGGVLVSSGPAKTEALLEALVLAEADVINVESILELHRLSTIAGRLGRRVPIALRVNPATVAVSGSLAMGGAPTQFGIPEPQVEQAVRVARDLPHLDLVGFQVHAVCNNLDADAHVAYVDWVLRWSADAAARFGVDLRRVDVGGGLGVPFSDETPLDLDRLAAGLAGLTPPAGVRVTFEPGRWLVTDCGWYVARVMDVKSAYGVDFVLLRGGINHFQIPTSWDLLHPFAVVAVEQWPLDWPRPEVRNGPVTVVGELCTPEDTLVRDLTVTHVRAGDVLVFPNAGSYGYEFAMPAFLGHPPAVRRMLPSRTAIGAGLGLASASI